MAKYMGEYYRTRTTKDLQILRSKKMNRLNKLRSMPKGYFVMKEISDLAANIRDIDAVLEERKLQRALFE